MVSYYYIPKQMILTKNGWGLLEFALHNDIFWFKKPGAITSKFYDHFSFAQMDCPPVLLSKQNIKNLQIGQKAARIAQLESCIMEDQL